MATQKALVVENGVQAQIDNADTLLVGAALDKSSTGTLTIGGTTATAITVGSTGITSTFPGALSVEGNVTLGNAASDNISFSGQIDTGVTWEGISAPSLAPAGTGRIYFDSSSNTFKISENGGAYIPLVGGSSGTVTSVNASGGTTGLSFSGGPVTTSGTLTLTDTLVVANGGTGATTLTGYVKGSGTSALTASASIPGSDVNGNITGNAAGVTGTVAVANGGTDSASLTANNVLLGNGTTALQVVAPSTSGKVLTSNGTTWASTAIASSGYLTFTSGSPTKYVDLTSGTYLRLTSTGIIYGADGAGASYPLTLQPGVNTAGGTGGDLKVQTIPTATAGGVVGAAVDQFIIKAEGEVVLTAGTLRGTDGSGTNISGGNLTVQGGRGTGTGTGGYVRVMTSPALASGTTLQTATERVRIINDGSVGIGTTSPASKLEVAGTVHSSSGGLKFPDGTTQTTAASTPTEIMVEYVVIGGGGAGGGPTAVGSSASGGGGAGAYLTSDYYIAASAILGVAYLVTVGAGGSSSSASTASTSGNQSRFGPILAVGGGRGAGRITGPTDYSAETGGSGGGGSNTSLAGAASLGKLDGLLGYDGGAGASGSYTGGGGGGAGAVGGAGVSTAAGDGGVGLYSSITGSSVGRAGGGGGSAPSNGNQGTATEGGGAGGYNVSTSAGANGTANTGGGGGGSYYVNKASGAGGSGIVILKYLSTYTATFSAGVTQSTTTSGSYKISQVTAAGTTDTVTFS